MRKTLQTLSSVFKMRIGVFIVVSAIVGLVATPGLKPNLWQILVLSLCVLASSAAAGAFNQYAERNTDALMERTKGRPFATGEYKGGPIWLVVIGLMLGLSIAISAFALNSMVALYLFLGAFVYGVVYTIWLKQRTSLNIVIGGLSGSFAVMAGGAAVDPNAPIPAILAVVMFLWTPPHFWSLASALSDDYARANIPMLPTQIGERRSAWIILAHVVVLAGLSLVPAFMGLGPIYFGFVAFGGLFFVWRSIEHVILPNRETAMKNFFASLIQLSALFAGVFSDAWIG